MINQINFDYIYSIYSPRRKVEPVLATTKLPLEQKKPDVFYIYNENGGITMVTPTGERVNIIA